VPHPVLIQQPVPSTESFMAAFKQAIRREGIEIDDIDTLTADQIRIILLREHAHNEHMDELMLMLESWDAEFLKLTELKREKALIIKKNAQKREEYDKALHTYEENVAYLSKISGIFIEQLKFLAS
jgi:DNA invertase Pin-like site-specific DNA recombinase